MSEQSEKKVMVNIGGLWVNKTKDGEVYLSGYLNGARLLIFKNKFKDSENKPDYIMNVVNPDKKHPLITELEAEISGGNLADNPPTPSDADAEIPF